MNRRYFILAFELLASNKRQHLIALLFHQLAAIGLDIQAQQWFRIRWAHIEPPVPKIKCNSIQMIDRLRLLAEMLLQRLQFALHVIDRAVDLPTSLAFVKRLEQFGE